MGYLNRLIVALLVVMTSMALVMTSVALAKRPDGSCPGNSCEAPGQNKVEGTDDSSPGNSYNAPGQENRLIKGSSDVKGNLKPGQHIYYAGDTLDVSIKFSRGWQLLADGMADAYVVVISPETELLSFPVDPSIGPSDRTFFTIELQSSETLPVGQYQLGLILTVPDGDPANLMHWRNGFRGLLDMEGILISDHPLAEDADMDGECDFDTDGDGFCDEESGTDDDDGDTVIVE